MRYFNTAGPCDPRFHYMVDAEARLPDARALVERGHYFVLHAPRQTGKTTLLRSLAAALTAEGRFAAVHFSAEVAEPAGDDYVAAQDAVLSQLRGQAELDLAVELRPPRWPEASALTRLGASLQAWAQACPRPLVLFIDEVDALRGESLRAVLRQLRAGFSNRPGAFPWSLVLCGLRDVRDYRVAAGGDPERLGTSSPFNVKVESLRLGDLSEPELRALYQHHTADTGRGFEATALDRLWELSRGQPWLANALGREVTEKLGLSAVEPITTEHVDQARERLILARQTHLDSLVARLHEPRVRRILEPLIASDVELPTDGAYDDDLSYVRDLGLIAPDDPVRTANPMYREVIVRALAYPVQSRVTQEPRSFVRDDGTLDLPRMLEGFLTFWREHGDVLAHGMPYHEVAPQLVLMAWLQRIVNGGGHIDREYGVGRGRIDLLLRWPWRDAGGRRRLQREALELKVWRPGRPDPIARGLAQLDGYLDRLGLDTGVLVVFDRRPEAGDVTARTSVERAATPSGRDVGLVRA